MQTITGKIYRLIELMGDPACTPATRLLLLLELAEDAQRLRIGSDDKIRTAARTADEVSRFVFRVHLSLSGVGPSVVFWTDGDS